MARLITSTEIAEKLGVSRQRVNQIAERPSFPAPRQTVRTWRLWDEDEVDAWLDQHRPGWRDQPQA